MTTHASLHKAVFLLLLAFVFLPCQAGEIRRTIDSMNFRKAPDDDTLLEPKFTNKEAFYALRPPAGWKKLPCAQGKQNLEFGVRFQNQENGDSLTIGLLEGGPKNLSIECLSLFRGDYTGTLRKSGLGRIVGSDLFRFSHFYCLQVLAQRKDTIVLQLLVFDQPGTFLQIAFSVGKNRYHALARSMEASIASLEWPVLRD